MLQQATFTLQKFHSLQRRGAAAQRCRLRLCVASKLVLVPTGDGRYEHVGRPVELPGKLELQPGKLYELGREAPADLVIPIPTVSGRHAIVRVAEDSTVTITDLNSTNGTFIEEKELPPMKTATLEQGATVVFGDKYLARFQLQVEADTSAPEAAASAPEAAAAE